MAYTGTAYGDISPEVAGHLSKDFLKRGQPELVIERFAQARPVPLHSTKVEVFRKYNALDNTPNALDEGVTGSGKKLTKTDITATLVQYGDHIEISDVVQDTHTDPVLKEATEVLGEQAAQMCEIIRFGVLKGGSNVIFANGSGRSDVTDKITRTLQRKVTRALKRQLARKITKVIRSTPARDRGRGCFVRVPVPCGLRVRYPVHGRIYTHREVRVHHPVAYGDRQGRGRAVREFDHF